jgi:hypothetical protein
MADFVIKTGDMLQVTVTPPAVIPQLVAPVPLIGTGAPVMVNQQPICLEGDELPPAVRVPLMYMSPPFVIPGMGTLTITLSPANKTLRTSVSGRSALLKGATFMATFSVTSPAMQPTPVGPVPDPVAVKPCTAQFITTTVNTMAG